MPNPSAVEAAIRADFQGQLCALAGPIAGGLCARRGSSLDHAEIAKASLSIARTVLLQSLAVPMPSDEELEELRKERL